MSETVSGGAPGPSVEPRPVPRFLAAGDTALVVEFGDTVDPATNHRVMRLGEAARAAGIAGLVDLVPTFRSLMVHYDPTVPSRRAAIGRASCRARVCQYV